MCTALPCVKSVRRSDASHMVRLTELLLCLVQVIKLMQSFKSKELVTERFAWRHYYWCGATHLLYIYVCLL